MTGLNIDSAYNLLFQGYPDVLDIKQLSRALGISQKTVYKLLREKEIRGFKVGRAYKIPKLFVMQYLEMIKPDESKGANNQMIVSK